MLCAKKLYLVTSKNTNLVSAVQKYHAGLTVIKLKHRLPCVLSWRNTFIHCKNSACCGFKIGAFDFLLAITSEACYHQKLLEASLLSLHPCLYISGKQMSIHSTACHYFDSAWGICTILRIGVVTWRLLG